MGTVYRLAATIYLLRLRVHTVTQYVDVRAHVNQYLHTRMRTDTVQIASESGVVSEVRAARSDGDE